MSRNPLRDHAPDPPDPPDPPPRERTRQTDLAALLEGTDQQLANELYEAFNAKAAENGARMPEAMWAVAMLQARILAQAEMGQTQTWVAGRFHEMVTAALPGMMLAVERGRRAFEGLPPSDA